MYVRSPPQQPGSCFDSQYQGLVSKEFYEGKCFMAIGDSTQFKSNSYGTQSQVKGSVGER